MFGVKTDSSIQQHSSKTAHDNIQIMKRIVC